MSLNIIVLIGRITAQPELRHTTSDIPVTTFTIAVDRSYAKPGAEKQTDFIDIVAYRSNAEFVCKYFQKGQEIAVQGELHTRSYTDNQGNRRKANEVIADVVRFVGAKKANTEATSGPAGDFTEVEDQDDLPF